MLKLLRFLQGTVKKIAATWLFYKNPLRMCLPKDNQATIKCLTRLPPTFHISSKVYVLFGKLTVDCLIYEIFQLGSLSSNLFIENCYC